MITETALVTPDRQHANQHANRERNSLSFRHLFDITKEADESMKDLLSGLNQEKVNTNILVAKDCPTAAKMRGLLLGRKLGKGATWDELWIGRLEQQLPNIRVQFDDTTGQVTSFSYEHREEVAIRISDALERLSRITAVLLETAKSIFPY